MKKLKVNTQKHAFEEIQKFTPEQQLRFVEAMEVISELLPQVDFGPKHDR